jgi:hypothetical protein
MHIEIPTDSNIVFVQASGRLSKADYEHFGPIVSKAIEEKGRIRLLFEMSDFHGWTAGALWEDVKFDVKHFRDIERVAIVGDARWQAGMAAFCRPFTTASIRYFDRAQLEEAQRWIAESN